MKLYRFAYSNYCNKVQMALEILGRGYELVDVPYGDRAELLKVSGGLVVPVLIEEDGKVIVDSRRICAHLAAGKDGERLVPRPLSGPVWSYADFCDGALEDLLFRLAAPGIRKQFTSVAERALFTLMKERRYGAGCLDAWERDQAALVGQASEALAPTLTTLDRVPFVFGATPTLADAALYGQLEMVRIGGRDPDDLGKPLGAWLARLPAVARR
jgi:glutathione S-transferase